MMSFDYYTTTMYFNRMKLTLLLAAFAIFSSDAFSQTQPSAAVIPCEQNFDCYVRGLGIQKTPVPIDQTLRLLGKGIQAKKTGQNLAIACVAEGQSCDILQFVYYANPQEVYFIGHRFSVAPELLETYLKKLGKDANRISRKNRGAWILLALGIGTAVVSPVVGFIPFFVVAGVGAVGASFHGTEGMGMPLDMSYNLRSVTLGNEGAPIVNQDGWNWASEPKRIPEKVFHGIVSDLIVMNSKFFSNENMVIYH